jgi:hypothetical protein
VKTFLFSVARLYRFGGPEGRLYSIGSDGTARGGCQEGHGSKMRYKGSSGTPVLF